MEAGRRLGNRLAHLEHKRPLVLALLPGSADFAIGLAERLDGDIDGVVCCPIRAPGRPDFTLGAVAEGGGLAWNETALAELGLSASSRDARLAEALTELEALRRELGPSRISVCGRSVIVSDVGVRTGATIRAAVASLLVQEPAEIVIAVATGPAAAIDQLHQIPGIEEVLPPMAAGSHSLAAAERAEWAGSF